MNDPLLPSWFVQVMAFCALAQTCLLVLACLLFREWASKLNRKLHRIESNTRPIAKVVTPEEEVDA